MDDELKRGVITDTLKLLGVSHRERLRKINRKKEDLQRRIVERTSYKESLQRKKEELEKVRKKRDAYERKNMGGFKLAFPNPNPEKQELYDKYVQASNCPLPFPGAKMNSSLNNGPNKKGKGDNRNSSTMPKLKKGGLSDKGGKASRTKDLSKQKVAKSPYDSSGRRIVTPLSQKRKRSGHKSNPKQM